MYDKLLITLQESQVKMIYSACFRVIKETMEQLKKTKDKKKQKELAERFQSALICLSFWEMGTQRRQIITAFTVKVHVILITFRTSNITRTIMSGLYILQEKKFQDKRGRE